MVEKVGIMVLLIPESCIDSMCLDGFVFSNHVDPFDREWRNEVCYHIVCSVGKSQPKQQVCDTNGDTYHCHCYRTICSLG
jgi:hypothetical protein